MLDPEVHNTKVFTSDLILTKSGFQTEKLQKQQKLKNNAFAPTFLNYK